ncbi:MAG: sulfatase-like hydrolase/transferase [Prevotella sp.]|nr:sulfatase-like hydrolase/transferase [Prevotella sp.]
MRQRLIYLCKFYLFTVVLFIIAKIIFMLVNHEGQSFPVGDVLNVVWHGLSLDLSTALYVLIVPFLATLVSLWWDGRWLTRILHAYNLLVAIILTLAFVADTSLYPFWHFKLDSLCLQYFDSPAEMRASVSGLYMTVRLIVLIVGVALVYKLYQRIPLWHKAPTYRSGATAGSILLIPLFVIGIRGGLDESTTNVGQVYFSQNQFLNHSAVNPLFNFVTSFEETSFYVPDYEFMSEDERHAAMEGLYFTHSIAPDSLLRTQRPNIVVILLESCGGIFTEDIGHRKDVMPQLNQLTKEGVYFANFYANSFRTDRGTLCTWSGFPSFPRSSIMKMPAKVRFMPGIAMSLKNAGYRTWYLYGGDINFTNMRSYLVTIGFEELHWKKDYSTEEQRSAKWGVRDDITFATLSDYLKTQAPTDPADARGPVLAGYSTLSSHEPWDVPTHRLDDEVLNAFNYLDGCIGDFVSEMKQSPLWENLLIILLPDHGYSYLGVEPTHPEHDHVPMLWLGGAVKAPRRVEQLCNQTDLPATLLGQLGIGHDEFKYSRDVMSQGYTYPFAIHTYNNAITMRDSTGFAVFDLNADRTIVDESTDSEALLKKGKAILQTAAKDFREAK